MSRVGKQKLNIPDGVKVAMEEVRHENHTTYKVTVTGPLGSLSREFGTDVKIVIDEAAKEISFERASDEVSSALWGTYASLVENMLTGVSKGYEKKLVIEGIGYRVEMSGTNLVFALGFSHPVKMEIPKEIKAKIEKNVITLTSPNKEALGQFAASIVAWKKPEPYKGKGILYEGQHVRRKQGKRSAA